MDKSKWIVFLIVMIVLSGCDALGTKAGSTSAKPAIDAEDLKRRAQGYIDGQNGVQATHTNVNVEQREATNDRGEKKWLAIVTGTANGEKWRVVMRGPHYDFVSFQINDRVTIHESGRPLIVDLNMISREPL